MVSLSDLKTVREHRRAPLVIAVMELPEVIRQRAIPVLIEPSSAEPWRRIIPPADFKPAHIGGEGHVQCKKAAVPSSLTGLVVVFTDPADSEVYAVWV